MCGSHVDSHFVILSTGEVGRCLLVFFFSFWPGDVTDSSVPRLFLPLTRAIICRLGTNTGQYKIGTFTALFGFNHSERSMALSHKRNKYCEDKERRTTCAQPYEQWSSHSLQMTINNAEDLCGLRLRKKQDNRHTGLNTSKVQSIDENG